MYTNNHFPLGDFSPPLDSALSGRVLSLTLLLSQTALSHSKNVNYDVTHATLIPEEMEQAIVEGRI